MPADQLATGTHPAGADAAARWRQFYVEFSDWADSERAAARHLAPVLDRAQAGGMVTAWWFMRKHPCWRVRVLPGRDGNGAEGVLGAAFSELASDGRIRGWRPGIYEAEEAAFGGPAAMATAHDLFTADSRRVMDLLAGTAMGLGRRELSVLLCTVLLRAAGLEWYEQGDAWHRVTAERPLPAGVADGQVTGLAESMATLLAADVTADGALFRTGGPLAAAGGWAAAFRRAGESLGTLARAGALQRGLREVLSYHVIFHWNRLGLPARQQAILAWAARDAILGPIPSRSPGPGRRPARLVGGEPDPGQVTGRFPLIPRPRLACTGLEARVAQVRASALSCGQAADVEQRIDLACTAWNQAALIASDCGLPGLAAQWCREQFAIHQAAWPASGRAAIASLQPLVNLARLDIRTGHAERGYQSLMNLRSAIRDGGTANIGGIPVSLANFTAVPDSTVTGWLRDVLLQDGTRALARTGQWDRAAEHAAWHDDTPGHMLEARQARIIASIRDGDTAFALSLASTGTPAEPWEDAVAACLRACAIRVAGQPLHEDAVRALAAIPGACPRNDAATLFRVRVTLTAAELATESGPDQERLTTHAINDARHSGDAHAAREILGSPLARAHASPADEEALVGIVGRAGLGCGAIPPRLMDDLAASLGTAGAALAQALTRDGHPCQ